MVAQSQLLELPATLALLQMIQGFLGSTSSLELGIPDLLKHGPKGSEELGQAAGTHPPSLYRLVRAMTGVGIFAEDDQQRFSLTPLETTLRSDFPGSLRSFVTEILGRSHYAAWEKMLYSVITGGTAFDHIYGLSWF